MGWFDRQIREIKQKDQEGFEESIFGLASAVLGKHDSGMAADERILTKAAIDEILKYYHFKTVDVPKNIKNAEDQLEYCLRPCGIMRRRIKLKEGWYKDSFGPVMAYRKDDDRPVALLPGKYTGYYLIDPAEGKRVHVNKELSKTFKEDALCFYRPLPQKELGVGDLIKYINSCLHKSDYAVYIFMTLLVTVIGMVTPYITRLLTGPVLESRNSYFLAGIAIFILATALSTMLLSSAKSLGLNRIKTKVSVMVEAAMMSRIMNLPAGFFRNYSSGELASRFSSANRICTLLIDSVFAAGLTSLASLLYIIQIFTFAPGLVLPAILIIVLTLAINLIAALMKMKISKAAMEASSKNSGLSYSLINGIQKIKLSGAEKRAFAKWAGVYSKEARLVYDPPLFLKVSTVITTAVSLIGTLVIYYVAVKTNVSPSEYLAFNSAYGVVMGAFLSLAGLAQSIAEIKPVLEMAEPILKTAPESSETKTVVTSIKGNIEMNNICFRYKESMPYVINGLNLNIRSGEYIAIVGTTGCGKSTLIRLLLGFEVPERGAVYYDGKDITNLDLKSLRRLIGVVTQNGSLFQGDIYSNIVISAPELTLDAAWEAAELAGIADDIRKMPMGMSTMISEGQGGISGGQKQRLMIARAIAPKPKVLIFDEATSALDNKTQKQVSDALDGLKCTRIVVAHRLSTIRHCDRILVLDKGNVVENGTYDELIAKNGLFAELAERQRLDV